MGAVIIPAIITKARAEAGVDSGNVSDAQAIIMVDDIYQELIDEKKLTNEDFLKKSSYIDTQVYQNKYPLPTDFEKMKQLSILYQAPSYTAWAASTVYAVGDKCTYGGKAWVCDYAHTSTASFPYTKTYTTSAIMVATETVTINGVVFTAKAAGAAANAGDFAIGASEAACLANLTACIMSATAGTAATFIALDEYNKSLLTDIEISATTDGVHTVTITYNKSITCSETSGVGAWGAETGGHRKQIYEGYVPCTQRILNYDFQSDFNQLSAGSPAYFYEGTNVLIYPWIDEVITQGIKFDYIPKLTTLTAATDDGLVYVEPKFYKAWIYGVAMRMRERIRDFEGAAQKQIKYIEHKDLARERWENRHYNAVTEELPISLLDYMR